MAVLVVYGRDLQQVNAWAWLLAGLKEGVRARLKLEHVLVYDNSPKPTAEAVAANEGCGYVHDPNNGGTAAAYERGIAVAIDRGIDWLLLLDQDTDLPPEFLDAAALALARRSAERPAALVPWLVDRGSVVSPARVTFLGTIRPLRRGRTVAHIRGLTAVSSGSIIRVAAVRQTLPFPKELWLDYVDHWMFARLNLLGERIAVLDQELQHSLSIKTPARLSRRRLNSILDGEAYFLRLLGPMARMMYPMRLLGRLTRYALTSPKTAISLVRWMID
jgi:GT2 family glycosyltransferase